jgi:hypothetical protein
MLQIHLYREERVVQGPALRSPREVREIVLRDPELASSPRASRTSAGVPRRKVVAEARGYVKEMAAAVQRLYFSILEFVFNWIWPRVFSGLEITGLERVIDRMKDHPIVLVPVPPEPLRLPDPHLHLPHQLPVAAAHRGRHQPELLADGAALPRRRRVLHPPHVRRQRALQDGLPEVPHVPHPRGVHAGVLPSRAAALAPGRCSPRSSACCRRS